MKLELKHLAPYLPYGLMLKNIHTEKIGQVNNIYTLGEGYDNDDIKLSIDFGFDEHIWMFKPILRPLSDLTKEIEHNNKYFIPLNVIKKDMLVEFSYSDRENIRSIKFPKGNICIISIGSEIVDECPLGFYNNLLEWHFDVFGLIEAGLAIDKNTLG